jgi:hypothetical protein
VAYQTLARFDPASVEDSKMYAVTAMAVVFQRDYAVAQILMPEEGRRREGRPHTFRGVLRRRAEDRMYFRAPDGAPNQWTATVRYADLVWITETTVNAELADL